MEDNLLTLAECARLAGVNASTISRQVKRGVMSIITTPRGKNLVELSEFLRVYPDAKIATDQDDRGRQQVETHTSATNAALERKLELQEMQIQGLREQLDAKEAQIQFLLKQLKKAEDHAENYAQAAAWARTALEEANHSRKALEERLLALPVGGKSSVSRNQVRDKAGRFCKAEQLTLE